MLQSAGLPLIAVMLVVATAIFIAVDFLVNHRNSLFGSTE
jgi:hypothetical protein